MRAQPKLTLEDCDKIQTENRNGTTATALSERFGVSRTIIYKILDGRYGPQIRARAEAVAKKQEEMPDGVPLCAVCGMSSRVPCPICTGNETVAGLDVTA